MMDENYILAKWLNNDMTREELAEFEASPDFEKYQRIKHYTSQLTVKDFDENAMLKNVLSSKKVDSEVIYIKKNNWFIKIAAVIIIGLGITFFAQNFIQITEYAENGKKTSFTLPDKSNVVLNSGSEISYKKWNWDNSRNIKLKGEAYFHVAKGKKFEVFTNLGKVSVLGTQFDVKARKNRFDITCFEGRVKVNYKNTEVILTHGQNVSFENGNQTNSTINTSKPEWLENNIAFNKENLRNILDEIERRYNVTISVNANYTNDLFTGKIPSNNLDIALHIIATTYNLKPNKISTNKIIFEEK
jgi:ferric-dicitrate binding protein FerR (iron transport regulator)